jgi:DNA-binding CsgD family transcriptional regulator
VEEHAEDDCRLEELIESVDKALLRAALTKLSRRHRAALQLWSAGAPSADIAARLGCTPGTADVTVHRARRRLRDRYLVLSGERSRWSLVPGVGAGLRWWDRVRARVSPKVAAVSDFCSPLAAKAAAALFVVSVTSSAGAASAGIVTMQAGLPTRPTVVLPAAVPARAATGRPAAVSSGIAVRESTRDAAVPRPRAEGPRGRSVKVGPLETPVREVTYDEFQEECRGAEIYVEKGGFAACANPHEAVRRVQSKIPAPR